MIELEKLVQRKRRALHEKKWLAYDAAALALGNFFADANQYQQALDVFVEATNVFRGKEAFRMALGRAHRMVAEMQILLENFDEAVLHVDKFLRIAQQEDNSVEEQRAYATIGRVHLLHGQSLTDNALSIVSLRKAETAFLRSLQVCKRLSINIGRLERIDMEARLYLNLGVTKEYLGDMDDTEKHMQKALALCRDHNLHELLHQCYITTASFVYAKRDDITKALRLLNLALGVAERLGARKKCETLLSKADIFIKSGDFQSARQTLHRAYRIRSAVKQDQAMIEQMLRTVAAICRAEDRLVTTVSTDYAAKKALFELLGDGSCQLKNYSKAIDYYQLMLANAEKCFVSERELVPIYVSLYQTYLDLGRNEDALVFMWKEFNLVKDTPKEAMTTLLTISDALNDCNRDFWEIDEVLQKARTECKRLIDPKTEAGIVLKMIALREKHRMMTLVEMLREEAKAAGLDLSAPVDDNDMESVSSEKNTLELGNDINLDELTGSESEDDPSPSEKSVRAKSPNASTSSGVAQRSRRGQSVAVKRNEKGETGLHQACISGNFPQVRRLLDQKHPVNVRDFAGWMPLHEAANHGHIEIVRLLIERGASINDKGGKMCDGVTALHDACGNGCLEVVELLLEAGANATMRTDLLETPLDTLEKWRARQQLSPVEQNMYDSVHLRLVRQIERSGISRVRVTPQKRCSQNSPVKRRQMLSPKRQISHSSSEDELPRPSATTIDGILQDEFATQFQYENDDDRSSSSHEQTPTANVSEYKSIMEILRSGGSSTTIARESPLKRLSDSSNGQKRRAGMLDTQEVGENWLEQDIVSVRKKPKMLSLSIGKNLKSDRSTPTKHQYQSKENSHPNRNSPAVSSINRVAVVSDDDSCSVDAFDMMMSAVGKVSSSTFRRRLSTSKPASSSHKQQSSLLSSGFVRFRSEHNLELSDDEHLVSSTLLDSDCSVVIPATAPTIVAPVIPTGSTFKVRVKEQLLNVPVNNGMIGDLTIGWLAEESSRRYYNLKGLQPVLEITSNDGAVYESSDPLAVVLGQTVETNVLEWILPSFTHRYQESCRQMQIKPDQNIHSILELIQSTHSLSLANQTLRPDISKPLFKAMHHQSHIESIDLSNNFLEDDSCRFLADGILTLTKLKSLKLSGNAITYQGLVTLTDKLLSGATSCLATLELLDLSHNPLGNEGMTYLTKLANMCPALRSLHLCDVDATQLTNLNAPSLIVLDVSHNQFDVTAIRKFLRSLNACKISVLNLGYCLNRDGGTATQMLAEWLQSGTLAALKELNLNGWDLDDGDVFELVQTLRRANAMDALFLMDNPHIETIGFVQLMQHIQVDRLYMDGCPAIGRHLTTTPDPFVGHSKSGIKWIRVSCNGQTSGNVDVFRRFWTRLHGSAAIVDAHRRQIILRLNGDQ